MDILSDAERFLMETERATLPLQQRQQRQQQRGVFVLHSPRGLCLSARTALFSCTPWQPEARVELVVSGSMITVRACETNEYWDGVAFSPQPRSLRLVLRDTDANTVTPLLKLGDCVGFEAGHLRFIALVVDKPVLAHAADFFTLGAVDCVALADDALTPPWLSPAAASVAEGGGGDDEPAVVRHLVQALLGWSEPPATRDPEVALVARRLHGGVRDVAALRRFARERARPEQCVTSQGLALHVQRFLDAFEDAAAALVDCGSLSRLIAGTSPVLRQAGEWAAFTEQCRGKRGARLLDGVTDEAALATASAGVMRQLSAWLERGEQSASATVDAGGSVQLDVPYFLLPHRALMLCPGSGARSGAALSFMGASPDAYAAQLAAVHARNTQAQLAAVRAQLPSRLQALKRLLLMGRGDVFADLLDSAARDLEAPASALTLSRIRTHLAMCLRRHGVDDDLGLVSCELAPCTLYAEMASVLGLDDSAPRRNDDDVAIASVDALVLVVKPERGGGPLERVLSRMALRKYSLLFRHLLRVKHAQARLHAAWLDYKARELHLLAHLLQTLAHYLAFEVLEPRWAGFEALLAAATSADDVVTAHAAMLDATLRESLLTVPRLVSSFNTVLECCAALCEPPMPADGRARTHAAVRGFLCALVEAGDFAALAKRMDWDGFYTTDSSSSSSQAP